MDGTPPELLASTGGETPRLELGGFSGPLDLLLALARDHKIDLARLPLPELVGQIAAAMEQTAPLSHKAGWVAMAAWLLHLRSRLLLPAETPAQKGAEKAARRLRSRLAGLHAAQALAAWLEARPQVGQDIFARGQPERVGLLRSARHEVDVVEFLWSVVALFEDGFPGPDAAPRYRPHPLDLHSIPDARRRIMRLLADGPARHALHQLLPDGITGAAGKQETALKRRSAWTSTFAASLELAKQGKVALAQDSALSTVQVSLQQTPETAS